MFNAHFVYRLADHCQVIMMLQRCPFTSLRGFIDLQRPLHNLSSVDLPCSLVVVTMNQTDSQTLSTALDLPRYEAEFRRRT